MNSSQLGLREAAELLGISKDTVWRAVQRQELNARFDHGPAGDQYWVSENDLESWWENRRHRKQRSAAPQFFQQEEAQIISRFPGGRPQESQVSESTQAVHTVLSAVPTATQDFAVFESLAAPASVPVEVHLQALRLVERAQLQLERAQQELRSTQLVLTEQAESLAEKESLAKQAALLAEENRQNLQQWESERAALTESLQQSKSKVEWLEMRVPRWVRKIFGAVA